MEYEVIGYDIIGASTKEESNVIGYAIVEEQTIDGYADTNANNNTTTGLADIIPGVNGPKLIMSTSVYVNEEATPFAFGAKIEWSGDAISRPSETLANLKYQTISEAYGEKEFTKFIGDSIYTSGILIPATGTYEIDAIYNTASSTFGFRYDYKKALGPGTASPTIHQFTGPYSSSQDSYKETFRIKFEEGDVIRMVVNVLRSASTSLYISGGIFATTTIKRIA